jgi:predicted amidohydrolase YtcJ
MTLPLLLTFAVLCAPGVTGLNVAHADMPGQRPPGAPAADIVVKNGQVLTVDPGSTVAEAVAIRDGVFVFVGSNKAAETWVEAKTRVIDAQRRTVVPGIIESHVHSVTAGPGHLQEPFEQLHSIGEIQDFVRRKAAKLPAGEWIHLPRVDVTRIREGRFPNRTDLDAAATNHPVVYGWQFAGVTLQVFNTAGLKAIGVTKDTPTPEGGEILKDAQGELTGVLRNAGPLTKGKITPRPKPTETETLDGIVALHKRYNEVGITSILERLTSPAGYRTLESLKNAGRLTVRANVTIGLESDGTVEGTEKVIKGLGLKPKEGDDWVRVGPLKIVADGGVLYGTARMRKPYDAKGALSLYGFKEPGHQGHLRLDPEKIKAMIRTGHRLGWQMSSHATGDQTVDHVLDAVEAAHGDSPITDKRYTLIHAYFVHPDIAKRAAALGVIVDTQPAWYYKDGDALLAALGKQRMAKFIGLKNWQRAGVKVSINADHMQGVDPIKSLNPYHPFLAMYMAATRKTERGSVFGPDQRVTRKDALRMMTIDAAYFSFDETKKGSIEVGKLGDLAILSDDYLKCPDKKLKDIVATATIVGGKVVYERP